MARMRSTKVASKSSRPVLQNCHSDLTWAGSVSSTADVSATNCLRRCRAWLPSGAHRQHVYFRVTYACRDDSPCSCFEVCHRDSENWLPHTGHTIFKPGKRRSGAHTNTLGHNTSARTSSHERAPSPSLRLRARDSSALRIRAAGCTQGSPASSIHPSSMLRVTSRTAVLRPQQASPLLLGSGSFQLHQETACLLN